MSNKKVLFVANYEDLEGADWFLFVAPENCDRIKEFKFAYEKEQGKGAFKHITERGIYDVNTAYDYRAKNDGNYNIKLFKD